MSKIYKDEGKKNKRVNNLSKHEIKKITVGGIFSWIFGILFLLAGAGSIATAPITGIIVVLCSAMIIPYFNKLIAEKFHFEISGGIKFLLVIVILITLGFSATNNESSITSQDEQLETKSTQSSNTQAQENTVL